MQTPSDGNFHMIRRSHAFPRPFPPGFRWDGTSVSVFNQLLSLLDLWRYVKIFLTLSSRRTAAPAARMELSALSPASGGCASIQVGCYGHPVRCFGSVFPPIPSDACMARQGAKLEAISPPLHELIVRSTFHTCSHWAQPSPASAAEPSCSQQ